MYVCLYTCVYRWMDGEIDSLVLLGIHMLLDIRGAHYHMDGHSLDVGGNGKTSFWIRVGVGQLVGLSYPLIYWS